MNDKIMIDVDELRQELGFSKNCKDCQREAWKCQNDYCYSLMNFCVHLDDAIEAILERHKKD